MENSTWAAGRHDVSCCRSERAQKTQNWNLPHFTSDVSGLRGGGGGKEPAEGACGHQSHTACLSCCLESWKGEIIICICLLSQTYGTRKSLLERRCSQLLLTSLTWPRRLLRKVLSELCWMAWDTVDTWYLLLTIISTTIVTYYLWVSHDFWC